MLNEPNSELPQILFCKLTTLQRYEVAGPIDRVVA